MGGRGAGIDCDRGAVRFLVRGEGGGGGVMVEAGACIQGLGAQ